MTNPLFNEPLVLLCVTLAFVPGLNDLWDELNFVFFETRGDSHTLRILPSCTAGFAELFSLTWAPRGWTQQASGYGVVMLPPRRRERGGGEKAIVPMRTKMNA